MWSKITNVLKPHQQKEEPPSQGSEVMSKVYEKHRNLSMFHASENGVVDQPHPSPPSSPSVHGKRNMFKRMSKGALKDTPEPPRASSPFTLPASISRKVRNQIDSQFNGRLYRPFLATSLNLTAYCRLSTLSPIQQKAVNQEICRDGHLTICFDLLQIYRIHLRIPHIQLKRSTAVRRLTCYGKTVHDDAFKHLPRPRMLLQIF